MIYEADRFAAMGTEWQAAWEKMRAVWDYPPSLEQFKHELSLHSRALRRPSPTEMADTLINRWKYEGKIAR